MQTPPASLIEPGAVLCGKYRVDRVLGQGGMGVVVAATHLQLGSQVAIKLLLPEVAKSTEVVSRFLREAQASTRITSEHVVRVLDVGTLERGEPFMVMEYLHGLDLGAALKQRGPLPLTAAVDYVLQSLVALVEAHGAGLVHRDLKPSNLFLTSRADGTPLVKVLDFGISKMADPERGDHGLTSTTSGIMGSPLYMSPEQIRSAKRVDARSDIWSLGVILYELVTDGPPFDADSMTGLFAAILTETFIPLRDRRGDLPRAFEEVVAQCLAKDPSRRFATVSALARELAPFASPAGKADLRRILLVESKISGSRRADPQASFAATATIAEPRAATAASWQVVSKAPASRRRLVVPSLIGAGVLVAGVAFFASYPAHRDQPRGRDARSAAEPLPVEEVVASAPQPAPQLAAPASASAASTAVASAAPSALPSSRPVRRGGPHQASTATPTVSPKPAKSGSLEDQINERK